MNNDINYNDVTLSGVINNIYDKNTFILFGLTCENYSKNNSKSYISLRIHENLYNKYKDLFYKGNKIFIKGYLNSYSSKNAIFNYVMVTDVSKVPMEIENNNSTPNIKYDSNGVMIWNNKRCEIDPPTEEEKQEMEDLLNEL